eukprot:TRINITY_DN4638_c0_g2_i18.p1 TRINITY_DN4638_c0_g2~~TRINITY_DN4638_c0_g2_i18.p1  ORF type:complete len:462 (+),score=90.26 TRINITY_DN4638_c0_g2_i18:465-1850(+)
MLWCAVPIVLRAACAACAGCAVLVCNVCPCAAPCVCCPLCRGTCPLLLCCPVCSVLPCTVQCVCRLNSVLHMNALPCVAMEPLRGLTSCWRVCYTRQRPGQHRRNPLSHHVCVAVSVSVPLYISVNLNLSVDSNVYSVLCCAVLHGVPRYSSQHAAGQWTGPLRRPTIVSAAMPRAAPSPLLAASVHVGAEHSFVLCHDSAVYTVGEARAIPEPLPSGLRAAQVACGRANTTLLTDQGEVYVCGDGRYSGLGTDGLVQALTRLPALWWKQVRSVAAGDLHAAALTSEEELFRWGDSTGSAAHSTGGTQHSEHTSCHLLASSVLSVACGPCCTLVLSRPPARSLRLRSRASTRASSPSLPLHCASSMHIATVRPHTQHSIQHSTPPEQHIRQVRRRSVLQPLESILQVLCCAVLTCADLCSPVPCHVPSSYSVPCWLHCAFAVCCGPCLVSVQPLADLAAQP